MTEADGLASGDPAPMLTFLRHELRDRMARLSAAACSPVGFLGPLREPGPHTRGCWALDLVLGRL